MPERRYFLDTCVFMYAVGGEHAYREPCARVVRAIGEGDVSAVSDAEVVQEITYRFHAIGRRAEGLRWARQFVALVPDILPVTRRDALRSLEVMQAHPSLAPCDAIHVAVMEAAGVAHIITADRHFARLSGVTRVDPIRALP